MGRFGIALTVVAFAPSLATAQTELQNDGFEDGMNVAVEAGFIVGEQGASRFIPTGTGPFGVQSVRLFFGGATTTETVTLNIYDDSAMTANPTAIVFTGEYNITGSDNQLSEIDLSGEGISVPGAFRVSIEFQHAGVPSIARDDDGDFQPGRNFIFAVNGGIGWVEASNLGVLGDWIIRTTITGGSGGDADAGPNGSDGGTTGGACVLNSDCPNGQYCSDSDECTLDCRLDIDCGGGQECNSIGQCVENGESGCGCQSSGRDSAGFGLLVLIALFVRVRKRR